MSADLRIGLHRTPALLCLRILCPARRIRSSVRCCYCDSSLSGSLRSWSSEKNVQRYVYLKMNTVDYECRDFFLFFESSRDVEC